MPNTQPKTAEEIIKERQQREKKLQEAAKPPIELGEMNILPHNQSEPQFYVRPGHLIATQQVARANQEDVQADVMTSTVFSDGEIIDLEHVPFRVAFDRPVALPKGQAKTLETLFFVPRSPSYDSGKRAFLNRHFAARSGSPAEFDHQQPVLWMREYQYHFVILAETPDAYRFIQRLHCVRPPQVALDAEEFPPYYLVQIPTDPSAGIPLPSHPFAWTCIAYILWDNLHPNQLTPDQQRAMLDWLHWGGQLIMSGPGSLEKLSGSFLEPYLPSARAAGKNLVQEDFAPLNAYWSLTEQKTKHVRSLTVKRAGMNGVRLAPHPDARFVEGTGELVCEGSVGRGRIVITAFPLNDRDVLNWGSLESFVNNALLRRPRRLYVKNGMGVFSEANLDQVELTFADRASLTRDARLGSTLRYFSRDVVEQETPPATADNTSPVARVDEDARAWELEGYEPAPRCGLAGWNDFGAVSNAARDTLREAAGISVPKSSFVLRVLVCYLIVLVPVNCLLFRLLGRLEWAWMTAPILAIITSLVVIRLAQLDIGFVRSRTEVATMEVHAGYPRAHLTRYTALYTSLSTTYACRFDDSAALALPFSSDPNYVRRPHDNVPVAHVERDRNFRLTGFSVSSNSTGVIHSEQMYDLEGTLDAVAVGEGQWELRNETGMTVHDAFVLARSDVGKWYYAVVGTWMPRTRIQVTLQAAADYPSIERQWRALPGWGGEEAKAGEIVLTRLAHVAASQVPLARGEMRLIGWSEEHWKGFDIQPASNQITSRTLVLVHLRRGLRPTPRPDENLYVDVADAPPPAGAPEDSSGASLEETTTPP